jgi:hypothetical protein
MTTLVLCLVLAADMEIPLSSITTTSNQTGLQQTNAHYRGDGDQKKYLFKHGSYLAMMYEKTSGLGSSNIFLVDAPDIDGAVAATSRMMIGGHGADTPAKLNQPNPPTGNYWLVVYLGVGPSSGPPVIADKATHNGKTIRFVFHYPRLGAKTQDVHQYFYWVPIGKLDNGTYNLELIEKDETKLMRRVKVQ